ncbi:hypothetical protein FOXYSP1_16265 [Fusarium oxysporum f. sp. phaseoli]
MSAFAFVASRVALSTLHQSLQHTLTLKKASHHYSPVTSPAVSLHTFNTQITMSFSSASKILSEGVGVGKDGAWYGVGPGASPRTAQWTGPSSCRNSGATIMSLASYTTPCAVVLKIDEVIWTMVNCLDDAMSTPPSKTFEPSTSPAVVVYQDTLYVVWNSSAADGTLRYTYVNKATNAFVQPKNLTAGGLSIRSKTSPAMVEFNGLLYLFFNGSGLNGTWMTTFNRNVWTDVSPVTSNLGGNFMDRTSPAIFVSDDKRVLTLLWYGSGSNGTWYTTTTNGITWSNQVGLNDGQVLMAGSSPCGIDYHGRPYIFFVGGDGNLWNYDGVILYSTLTEPKYSLAMDAFLEGNDFAFVAQDDATVKYLEAQFANGSVIIQNPSSSPNIIQSANPRNQTVAGNANWINLWHYFYNGSPSAITREAVSLLALATLAFNFNYLISINTDSQMRFSPRLIFHRIPPNKG